MLSPGSRSAARALRPAPDEDAFEAHDDDGPQHQQRHDRLHDVRADEQQHEQDQQPVHVVLADPPLGVDVVAGERLDRAAVPGRQRPRLAPAHRFHPAGTVRPLAGAGGAGGLLAVLGSGVGLAAAALGLAALGSGLSLARRHGTRPGGGGVGVGRGGGAVDGFLAWPLVRGGAASSEHALSLPGAIARMPRLRTWRGKPLRRPPAGCRGAVAVVMTHLPVTA